MFTGLIVERGRLIADPVPSGQGGVRLAVGMSPELAERLAIGDSLAVSGVCLTVTENVDAGRCWSSSPPRRWRGPPSADLRDGDEVNLEPALRMGDPLGGHMVQGHVDGTAEVMDRRDLGEHRVLAFSIPPRARAVPGGEGVGDGRRRQPDRLRPPPDRFEVALIPHTLAMTTLSLRAPGDRVNLEMDVIGKYVHRHPRGPRAGRPPLPRRRTRG